MKDYFFLAFNNLKRRKLRSWLTMIGIFIGIAAVVALISLGQGLQNGIEEQFERLGSDKIIIMSAVFAPPGSITSDSLILTKEDLEFVRDIRGIKEVVGYLGKYGQVNYKKESKVVYVGGMNSEDVDFWEESNSLDIKEGRVFEKGERFKAVVGYNHIYKNMWDKPMKLGGIVEIEGQEFKIIGVIEKTGDNNDDSTIYLPKETMREIFDIPEEESVIMAKTEKSFDPEEVAGNVERKLTKFRREKEGQETFSVQTSGQLLESFSNIFGIVQAVLIGIAAISLLVGGIGIMNTMYTAVIERTKEIGVMKAIGAKNSDILLIFLFEAGLLGLVGGAIGIFIGVGLGKGTEYIALNFLDTSLLQAAFPLPLIIGALLFSFLIGATSGILPAMQAAKLRPAHALRYE